MTTEQILAVSIFCTVFAAIISEKIDKTIIVLLAAVLIIFAGLSSFDQAIGAIDFHTITLLLGMMVIVESLKEIKIFDWFAIRVGVLTRGEPVLIFTVVGIATAVLSAFLDNVTTVLVIAPLMIALTQGLGLPPRVFLMSVIFLSNVGGTATLIGDPPNILIGSQVRSLTFLSFLKFLTPPVILSIGVVLLYFRRRYRDQIRSRRGNFAWLFTSKLLLQDLKRQEAALEIPRHVLLRAGGLLTLVLVGFFSHSLTHIDPSVVALAGATFFLLAFPKTINIHHALAKVEWPTLLFFAGLFVVVGAMEHSGVLALIAHSLISITDNLWLLMMIILFASAFLSAIVDNIPFVAVMIPVIKGVLVNPNFTSDPNASLLWWALAAGACFGGNGTMVGASANVVTCAIAESRGIHMGFKEFLRDSVPVTLLTVVIAGLYLTLLYFV